MKKITAFILLLGLYIPSLVSQTNNGIIVSNTGNITVVKVWGTHQERGFAVGYLLAAKIKAIYEGYIKPEFGTSLPAAKTMLQQGIHIKIDSVFIYEAMAMISGMAAAGVDTTGLNYLDILVANSYLDISGLGAYKNLNLEHGCSSLMSWGDATAGTDLDGKSVISRHLDWTPAAAITANQVMVIHLPAEADEQPWLLIGFAGQMSVLSGLNNSGISAFQHMLSDFTGSASLNKGYEPIWLSIRKGLEKVDFNQDGVSNVLDIKDAVSGNAYGYADGFIVTALAPSTAGADSLTALVAELTPVAPQLTFRGNEFADNIPGDNLYAANYEIKRNNHLHYCTRYNSVKNNIGNGTGIGSIENWNLMRNYSNASSSNIQFMQVIPELRVLNLAVYKNNVAAYLNTPNIYDLDSLFDFVSGCSAFSVGGKGIAIFPNPFTSETVIKFSPFEKKPFTISLYNSQGAPVKTFNNITTDSFVINGNSLGRGVYYIQSSTGDGKMYYGKLVVQ